MKRALLALFALALLALPCHAGPLVDQVLTPSVEVSAPYGRGSGTVIRCGDEVLILTAAHVVESCQSVRTVTRYVDGKPVERKVTTTSPATVTSRHGRHTVSRKAHLVAYDEDYDLALLKPVDAKGLHPAELGDVGLELEPGEDAWYCGSGGGLPWNLQKTVINQDDDEWTTVNGGGWFGHSGAGLFVRRDKRHVLVGVVVQLYSTSNPKSPVRCVTRAQLADFLNASRGKP